MSRALTALRYLAAPFIGLLSPDLVATLRQENARADAAELNEARAKGERDEARRVTAAAGRASIENARELDRAGDRARELEREIETLRSEAESSRAADEEHVDLAATLADVSRERDALLTASASHAAEVNALRADVRRLQADESDAVRQLRSQANALSADLSAQRVRVRELETMLDARADVTPEPVKANAGERCTWCGEPVGASDEWFYADVGDNDNCDHLNVCHRCSLAPKVDGDAVRARVATRAASCPARRDSPDPLAKACNDDGGCGAQEGQTCDAHKAYLASVPFD